jgi:hypothetical protein
MRCCFATLTMVVTLAASGLSLPQPVLAQADAANGVCDAVVSDLRSQIEAIKEAKARSRVAAPRFAGKHGETSASAEEAMRRAREQADALNAMLPGMGCPRLDIDTELTLPMNHALLHAPSTTSKKHRSPRL